MHTITLSTQAVLDSWVKCGHRPPVPVGVLSQPAPANPDASLMLVKSMGAASGLAGGVGSENPCFCQCEKLVLPSASTSELLTVGRYKQCSGLRLRAFWSARLSACYVVFIAHTMFISCFLLFP